MFNTEGSEHSIGDKVGPQLMFVYEPTKDLPVSSAMPRLFSACFPTGPYDLRMDVRHAIPRDCSGIGAVHVEAWQAAYRGEFPEEYLDGLDPGERAGYWTVVLDRTMDLDSRLIVAEDAGSIVGFGCFGHANGVDRRGELYAMNVHPSHWRMGVGSLLLDSVSSQLIELGLPDALLWTGQRNTRAQAFYAARGWELDGTKRKATVHGASVAEVRLAKLLTQDAREGARPGRD